MGTLKIDYCSFQAAKYAVMTWHYSRRMPLGKLLRLGIWEDEMFIGAIIFGRGAAMHIGTPFGLEQTEACELLRIALNEHEVAVSHIVSEALSILRYDNPGMRLVVSYADTAQGHLGKIYQASNWIYLGPRYARSIYVAGEVMHQRSVATRYGRASVQWLRTHIDPEARGVAGMPKLKYAYPLDRAMRRKISKRGRPYPTADELQIWKNEHIERAGEVSEVTRQSA